MSDQNEVILSPRETDLEDRVRKEPFDTDAWEELSSLALESKHIEWVKYLQAEESFGDEEGVKNILRRSLKLSYSVEIWAFYLSWLRRPRPETDAQKVRAELSDAFEQAVRHDGVGWSMEANTIWRMYIDFLLEEPENTPYEQGQKMDALRKVYRQALTVPIRGLDALWKEYQNYETSKHERIAKQLIDDMTKNFSHAAEVLKEREQYWRPVLAKKSPNLPRKPSPSNQKNNVEAWMQCLNYERTNPEQLAPDLFRVRVRLAYRRALSDLYFHPDAWFSFFDFEKSVQDMEAGLTVLRESLRALPDSELLHFCLADALESAGAMDEARSVHDKLLERNATSIAFVQRMRFARRVDGIAAAREVFRRARTHKQCEPGVYCAASDIELGFNKQVETARKVLDLGLKRFPSSALLCHTYIDLVLPLKDEQSAREVFERCIASLQHHQQANQPVGTQTGANQDLASVFERFRDFARDQCRDLVLLSEVEKRMQAELHTSPSLGAMLHRYVLYGLSPSLESVSVDVEQLSASASASSKQNQHILQALSVANEDAQEVNTSTTSATNATSQQFPSQEVDETVPLFLRKLVGLLPKRLTGIASMDVDFVMRNLIKGTLPPAPTGPARAGGNNNTDGEVAATNLVAKRRRADQLGADGAPVDAFKERQKRGRQV